MDTESALASVDAHLASAREALVALTRIPSISASPEHAGAVRASAEAAAELLRAHGLEAVRLADVDGSHPYVIGEWTHAGPDAPTVLLYAHHDVQPPGIVENWRSDPFEPVEREGRLYGRGVADDKAGVVADATAVKAWLDTSGALPCNVKVLIEGEEEIGSPSLYAFLTAHVDELRSDVLVLADAENWAIGEPGITVSLRGLANATIELRALDGPVHSGMGGGVVPDPVMALARVLTSLVDERGDVAIDGVWDDVIPVDVPERARLGGLGSDEEYGRVMKMRPGVQMAGDPDVPRLEKLWARPSLTVIGIDGHPVHGSSNQIVARATARVSMRLAPGQDPHRVLEQLRAHVTRHVPWGLELTFTPGVGAPAWHTDPAGPAFDAARRALRAGYGVDAVTMGIGGSIPFVGPFAAALGAPALLIGPNDPGNGIHGENESLHLADWRSLIRSEVCLLAELSEQLGPRAKR